LRAIFAANGCSRSVCAIIRTCVVAQPGAVISDAEKWNRELGSLIDVQVHINDYFTADLKLIERIKISGLLAFSRHASDADFEFEDELPEFDPAVP
jgi:hypothetical protein